MSLDRAQREQTSTELRANYRLADVIGARGEHPHPHTYLTDDMRADAERWFPSLPARRARR